jgi:hypothetical protein
VGLIAAGANHTLAVKSGGALFVWGNNSNGQVGNGNITNQPSPLPLGTPSAVVAITGGARHSAAITSERQLHVWGDNFFGQVGNRSGNYNPHSASLNVLRGDSVISEDQDAAQGGNNGGANIGSSVLEIEGQATTFEFGPITTFGSRLVTGRYKNASTTTSITNLVLSVTGTSFSLADTNCPSTLEQGAECTFAIGFNPTQALPYSGEVVVASSLVGSPERRTVNGTGVPPATPAISFAKTGYDFPPQVVGNATAPVAYALTNTGSATLSVTTVVPSLGRLLGIAQLRGSGPGRKLRDQHHFQSGDDWCACGRPRRHVERARLAPHGEGVGDGCADDRGVRARRREVTKGPRGLAQRSWHRRWPADLRRYSRGAARGNAFDRLPVQQRNHGDGDGDREGCGQQQRGYGFRGAKRQRGRRDDRGRAEAQRLVVSVTNVNNAGVNASIAVGFLAGDVDGTRSVTASDILRVKGRAGAANSANFAHDTDASGTIDTADVASVKARAGLQL